ncbi:hypothetical protein BB561_006398 [Smittium simulii]|uniref:Mob1/phocein n=1 Tax=Smittium simulii TaxID=133385 RepID=A0A2T9Y4P3_9FUNG|nr:hypothetical protein BB561_006398 [Smittium simulii]
MEKGFNEKVGVTSRFQLKQFGENSLGKDVLKEAVTLPEGEDINEWVACHVLDFYNHTNMLYSSIAHSCNQQSCPVMSAGSKYEYLWNDKNHPKSPIRMSAFDYITKLMFWINQQIENESYFPSKQGNLFRDDFISVIAPTIFRRLLRVYSHMYYHHLAEISKYGLKTMLNTSFHHFVLFATKFHLIEYNEFAPVREIIKNLL